MGLVACKPSDECTLSTRVLGELSLKTLEPDHYHQNDRGYVSVHLEDCGTFGCTAWLTEVGIDDSGPFTIDTEAKCR